VLSHHATIADNETIAITEAVARKKAHENEADAAARFAEKLTALLS